MKLKKITILTSLAMLASAQGYSHGYVDKPASRNYMCKLGNNSNCGNKARYEPQSVEQADYAFNDRAGNPLDILDNTMGSAGVSGFEQLDEQEQSRWAKTTAKSGEPLNIKWHFTANHKSKFFKFYITKPSWNPDALLTRDSFEAQPLNCYNPQPAWQPPEQPSLIEGITYTCTMPERSGYQVIMAVWDVDDTAASFYNLIDLQFTNESPAGEVINSAKNGGSSSGNADTTVKAFNASTTYNVANTEVVYDGKVYKNKWYVNANAPAPGTEQWGPWEYVRDATDEVVVNPNDSHPVEATKFLINPMHVSVGDKIRLFIFENGQSKYIDLLTVPEGMKAGELLKLVANRINEVSVSQLDNNIIAGVKTANGEVAPSSDDLFVYQVSSKPYAQISIEHTMADHNLKNMLHLMDFKNKYTHDENGDVYINAKIMSHGSKDANVSVVLQDKAGNEIQRQTKISIKPMDTYDLTWKLEKLDEGDYSLIVSSEMAGAKAWQKSMDINIAASDDTTTTDKNVKVDVKSNTPFYQVNDNDTVTPRTWYADLGTINFSDGQVRVIPWSKAGQASGNSASNYVTCPKPSNYQDDITYIIEGDLTSLSCKIQDS